MAPASSRSREVIEAYPAVEFSAHSLPSRWLGFVHDDRLLLVALANHSSNSRWRAWSVNAALSVSRSASQAEIASGSSREGNICKSRVNAAGGQFDDSAVVLLGERAPRLLPAGAPTTETGRRGSSRRKQSRSSTSTSGRASKATGELSTPL